MGYSPLIILLREVSPWLIGVACVVVMGNLWTIFFASLLVLFGVKYLTWLVWQEHNTRTFEDIERPLGLLKSLLFGTLFQWARIFGFMPCISISNFLQSVSFSS